MTTYELRPVGMSVVEAGTVQPRLTFVGLVGEHRITFDTTAKGYAQLTGRRHRRVSTMHAAYGKRRGRR